MGEDTEPSKQRILTSNNVNIEGASSTVARSIGKCVGHLCGSHAEERSRCVRPGACRDCARVVGGSWLSPDYGGSRAARCRGCGDVVDAAYGGCDSVG